MTINNVISISAFPKGEQIRGYAGGMHFDMRELAELAFGKPGSEKGNGLTLFAYLWRRFGPPWFGCDDHKELAVYILTTQIDGLWLEASCKASSLHYCFRVCLTRSLESEFPPGWRDEENEILVQCKAELIRVMRDLLRPVNVRDVIINALGISDEIFLFPGTEEEWDAYVCEPSQYAGYGLAMCKVELDRSSDIPKKTPLY